MGEGRRERGDGRRRKKGKRIHNDAVEKVRRKVAREEEHF